MLTKKNREDTVRIWSVGFMQHRTASEGLLKKEQDIELSNKVENLLKLRFKPAKPKQNPVTDVTSIRISDRGFLHLSALLDLFGRSVVAYHYSYSNVPGMLGKCFSLHVTRDTGNSCFV